MSRVERDCRFQLGCRRRAGMALPLVLVCLLVAMLLAAAVTRSVLMHARQAAIMAQQQQTSWLAESGVQRAIQQLRLSNEYRGEEWHVPAASLGGASDGAIRIAVEPEGNDRAWWEIHVEAIYPEHPPHRVTVQRELSVDARSLRRETGGTE